MLHRLKSNKYTASKYSIPQITPHSNLSPQFCRVIQNWQSYHFSCSRSICNNCGKILLMKNFWATVSCTAQVIGRLFAPSQKLKKLTQQFRQCFQLALGILNAIRKIFWVVYGPHRELRGLQGVGFQGKNCFIKMVPNFSEINFGFTKP